MEGQLSLSKRRTTAAEPTHHLPLLLPPSSRLLHEQQRQQHRMWLLLTFQVNAMRLSYYTASSPHLLLSPPSPRVERM